MSELYDRIQLMVGDRTYSLEEFELPDMLIIWDEIDNLNRLETRYDPSKNKYILTRVIKASNCSEHIEILGEYESIEEIKQILENGKPNPMVDIEEDLSNIERKEND